MGNRFDVAAVRRVAPALIVVSVLIFVAVLGYLWNPGGTWSEVEAVRTDARVVDIEWLDDASIPSLICMRRIWQYEDRSGESHSFTTLSSWTQKPTINGHILESGRYVRTELLDPDDFWAWSPYQVTLQEMLDAERSARKDNLTIKYLIDEPEKWRDAAKDDNGDYLNKPAWLSFLVVVTPGLLAIMKLQHAFAELFPGCVRRRRRFQRET